MASKFEYKKITRKRKFDKRRELKFINKFGLKGWELFSMFMMEHYRVYHLRKKKINHS